MKHLFRTQLSFVLASTLTLFSGSALGVSVFTGSAFAGSALTDSDTAESVEADSDCLISSGLTLTF